MKFPWLSWPDRRRWRAPQSVTELGQPMALWLEGEIRSWPGYSPGWGPDEETAHLVPTLAALCRHRRPGTTPPPPAGGPWTRSPTSRSTTPRS